jgi:hypothetical protein
MDGKPSVEAFALSSQDEQEDPPILSVWAERLTTPAQAFRLMGSSPRYTLLLRLNVDQIRSIVPEPSDLPKVPPLDVIWIRHEEAGIVPGAEGHAGITGLKRTPPVDRRHTKSFRLQLLRCAEIRTLSPKDEP